MDESKNNQLIQQFFMNLSERNWNENNLSDFFYSLFKSSREFRTIIYNILNKKNPNKNILFFEENFDGIIREPSYDQGRPDFLINQKKAQTDIIIENKKYDTDFHIIQYNEIKDTIKCLITINKYKESVNDQSKDWIKLIWSEITEQMDTSTNSFIKSISQFFKEICKMQEIKRVETFDIQNLLYLNRMIEKVISESKFELTPRVKSFTNEGSGYAFQCNFGEKAIYPWLGFNYNEVNPFGLMFWLNTYSGHKPIHEKIKNTTQFPNKYFENYEADQVVIMTLRNDNERDEFLVLNKEEQVDFIKNFLDTIINKIGKLVIE